VSYIQDGWGDALTPVERIAQLERLNGIRARERAHAGAEYDDLLQEARIAVWEVAVRYPDKSREYLSASAAMRVREVSSRQNWTGHTRVHGQPTDPLRQRGKESMDDPDFTLWEALDGPVWLDGALLSYHRGEIAKAIDELPPRQRQYVLLRFWCGYGHMEIKREFGMSDSTWAGAKHNLSTKLAYLVSV